MSDRPIKVVIDCSNNTEQYIPMTDEEIIEHEKLSAQIAESNAKREAEEKARAALRESARAKLVAGQPLTEEEAATIVL